MFGESEYIFDDAEKQPNVPERKKGKRARKQSVQWTKEDARRLVLAVKTEQCLWDYSAAIYKDRDKRELAWANVAGIVGQTTEECTHKWNSLRVNYRTTITKMNATKSGQEAVAKNALSDPYSAMRFLGHILNLVPKPHVDTQVEIQASTSTSAIASVAGSDSEPETVPQLNSTTEEIEMTANDLVTDSPPEKRRLVVKKSNHPTSEPRREALLHNAMNSLQQRDEWDSYGEFVAVNARGWEPDVAARFKLEMLALILKFGTSDLEQKQAKRAAGIIKEIPQQ